MRYHMEVFAKNTWIQKCTPRLVKFIIHLKNETETLVSLSTIFGFDFDILHIFHSLPQIGNVFHDT